MSIGTDSMFGGAPPAQLLRLNKPLIVFPNRRLDERCDKLGGVGVSIGDLGDTADGGGSGDSDDGDCR